MSNLTITCLSRQRRNWSTRVTSAVSKRRVNAGTLFARTESDIAAAFREETANHSWNADDLAAQAGIDPRFADALLQRGEAPIEAVFSAAMALGIDIAALPLSSLGNTR